MVCKQVIGTVANWGLNGCTQPAITSRASQAIDRPFPTAVGPYTATITWSNLDQQPPGTPGTTTISVNVTSPRKDKCASGSTEWQLVGSISANTTVPGVKGKVKIVACVSTSNAVTNTLGSGGFKPARF